MSRRHIRWQAHLPRLASLVSVGNVLVFFFVISPAFSLTLDNTQDLDTYLDITGTNSENVSWTGTAYDWDDAQASSNLYMGNHYLYTDEGGDIILDLGRGGAKGNITGTNAVGLSTDIGSGDFNAGNIIITNAGDVSMGALNARVNSSSGTNDSSGSISIGSPGNRVGNLRINGIRTDGVTYCHPGDVTIYSTGSVRIQNSDNDATAVRGNIQTFVVGMNSTKGRVIVHHSGGFRAGTIDTSGDWDNYCRAHDILLNGGGGGTLDVMAFDASQSKSDNRYGNISGNISISNYTEVLIGSLDTHNGWSHAAGDVRITNISGNIHITGTINLDSKTNANNGDLILQADQAIMLLDMDMDQVKSARFNAGEGRTTISNILSNFGTDTSGGSGTFDNAYMTTQTTLRTPNDQFIIYNAATNASLGGYAYRVADMTGNAGLGGRLLPLDRFPGQGGTVFRFR